MLQSEHSGGHVLEAGRLRCGTGQPRLPRAQRRLEEQEPQGWFKV